MKSIPVQPTDKKIRGSEKSQQLASRSRRRCRGAVCFPLGLRVGHGECVMCLRVRQPQGRGRAVEYLRNRRDHPAHLIDSSDAEVRNSRVRLARAVRRRGRTVDAEHAPAYRSTGNVKNRQILRIAAHLCLRGRSRLGLVWSHEAPTIASWRHRGRRA